MAAQSSLCSLLLQPPSSSDSGAGGRLGCAHTPVAIKPPRMSERGWRVGSSLGPCSCGCRGDGGCMARAVVGPCLAERKGLGIAVELMKV